MLGPLNVPISHENQVVGSEKSLPRLKLNGGVLFRLPMECTLKTLGTPICSSGAVGTFVRAAANVVRSKGGFKGGGQRLPLPHRDQKVGKTQD